MITPEEFYRRWDKNRSYHGSYHIEEMFDLYGISAFHIQEVTGATSEKVRQWINGYGLYSLEDRDTLAWLHTILEVLEYECGKYYNTMTWLSMYHSMNHGYVLQPFRLIISGHIAELFEIACDQRTEDYRLLRLGTLSELERLRSDSSDSTVLNDRKSRSVGNIKH